MFWNIILKKLVNKNSLTINKIKNKNVLWYLDSKVKNAFKKFNQKNKNISNTLFTFLKNIKYSKYSVQRIVVTLNKNIHKSNKKQSKINTMFSIFLKRKQTYININLNNKKIVHNTNGIVLKEHNIIEKSRKKDQKISLLNLSKSIDILKKRQEITYNKNHIIIVIKFVKPILTRIVKSVHSNLKDFDKTIIITPSIGFTCSKFKKIKSIKRRLRKKYKLIDV